jgi:inorganic pyrophosphatase
VGAGLARLPARGADNSVAVVIESPRGSASKFKYDPELDVILLSRPLPAGVVYPHDWGFVPSTRASDGDPLDAIVLWEGTSYPGVVIFCRLIGVLKVEQTNLETGGLERNDRLAALPVKAPTLESIRSVFDIAQQTRAELEQFFLNVVAFEGKDLELLGWSGPEEAEALLNRSV